MGDPTFSVRMASHIYLDSNGNIHGQPVKGVPTYVTDSGDLPFKPEDLEEAEKAFKGAAEKIQNLTDPKSRDNLTLRWLGINGGMLSFVKGMGELCAGIASAIPYVGAAIAFLKMFGVFSDGKDPLVETLKAEFAQTNQLITGFQKRWLESHMLSLQTGVLGQVGKTESFVKKLHQYAEIPPTNEEWATLSNERNFLRDQEPNTAGDLLLILDPAHWTSYVEGRKRGEETTAGNPWRPLNLYRLPTHSDSPTFSDATPEHVGTVEMPDHRAMVYIVPSLVQAYLLQLKSLLPEHRSVGRSKGNIRKLAIAVETLANLTRNNIVRTHFFPSDFMGEYRTDEIPLVSGFVVPPQSTVSVGSWDLVSPWPPNNLLAAHEAEQVAEGKTVDLERVIYNRPVPSKRVLARWEYKGVSAAKEGIWEYPDPDRIAKELNKEAALRYANLLALSGYPQLMQLAGLLRHLYTEPASSEIVAGRFQPSWKNGEGISVEIKSRPLTPYPQLIGYGQLVPQEMKVKCRFSMQSPFRSITDPVNFRVWFRTLPAEPGGEETSYQSHYSTEIEKEPPTDDTRAPFDRITFRYSGCLDEHLVVEGRSQREPVPLESSSITLEADTFDIWVPGYDGAGGSVEEDEREAASLASIRESVGLGVAEGIGRKSDLIDLIQGEPARAMNDWGFDSVSQLTGERRNRKSKRESVDFTSSGVWDGPILELELSFPAGCRNFDLYLVVEESVGWGPDSPTRHTPFKIPVSGQMTYVPQEFLAEEANQLKKSRSFWAESIRKYSESRRPSPRDPFRAITPQELDSDVIRLEVASTFQAVAPEFLKEQIRSYGL
jgi:hypothetical protein